MKTLAAKPDAKPNRSPKHMKRRLQQSADIGTPQVPLYPAQQIAPQHEVGSDWQSAS